MKCLITIVLLAAILSACTPKEPIAIPQPINFPPRVVSVTSDQRGKIEATAKMLKENPGVRIKLIGHTDSVECFPESARSAHDPGPICKDVSMQRAVYVRSRLYVSGVSQEQFLLDESEGETQPKAPNETEDGRAENRRVEFVVYLP